MFATTSFILEPFVSSMRLTYQIWNEDTNVVIVQIRYWTVMFWKIWNTWIQILSGCLQYNRKLLIEKMIAVNDANVWYNCDAYKDDEVLCINRFNELWNIWL